MKRNYTVENPRNATTKLMYILAPHICLVGGKWKTGHYVPRYAQWKLMWITKSLKEQAIWSIIGSWKNKNNKK